MRFRGLFQMRGRLGFFLHGAHAHKHAFTHARGPRVAITAGTKATTVSAMFDPPSINAKELGWGPFIPFTRRINSVVTCGGLIIKRFGLATHISIVMHVLKGLQHDQETCGNI